MSSSSSLSSPIGNPNSGSNNNNSGSSRAPMLRQSVRSIGDGSTAVQAFRDALNKPDFADVIFEVSKPASARDNNSSGSASQHTSSTGSSNKNAAQKSSDGEESHTIYAHRAILAARSPVFKEMFFGGYPESRQKSVVVEDFRFDHFMTVLEWAYCGAAEMSAKDVLGVLQCANYYGLDDLMAECRELAQSFIDEENVLHLLEHASGLGESALVVQCLGFIKAHAHAVLSSPVWLNVSAECVERVLSLPAIDCEEALLFDQCMAWLEQNTTVREDMAEALKRKAASDKERVQQQQHQKKKSTAPTTTKLRSNEKPGTKKSIDKSTDSKKKTTESTSEETKNDSNPSSATGDDGKERNKKSEDNATSTADPHDADADEHDDDVDQDAEYGDHDDYTDGVSEGDYSQHHHHDEDAAGSARTETGAGAGAAAASSSSSSSVAAAVSLSAGEKSTTGSGGGKLPSAPYVRRFFRLLRLSHLSVTHLLDRIRPLLVAHPSIRSAYVAALEYLVAPGHVGGVAQVPRAPTVLGTVQVDVSVEFLRGWKILLSVPQSTATGLGFNQTSLLPTNFFADVPAHAAYLCVGEMVVGREDAISVMAVGCVRIVRPMIGSRAPMVQEDGDICWHSSPTTFGFSPRNAGSGGGGSGSGGRGGPPTAVARPASSTPTARALAGVRFTVATLQQQQMGQMVQEDGPQRHGKRFIYYK